MPEIVTGKPPVLGGTAGRPSATGLGAPSRSRARWRTGAHDRRPAVVVQGFGNVGAVVAREISHRGGVVVGVSDVTGGVVNPTGSTSRRCSQWRETGFLRGFAAGEPVGRMDILETPCDVLVPAALERQITAENASPPGLRPGRRGRQRADHAGGRRDPGRARRDRVPRPAGQRAAE